MSHDTTLGGAATVRGGTQPKMPIMERPQRGGEMSQTMLSPHLQSLMLAIPQSPCPDGAGTHADTCGSVLPIPPEEDVQKVLPGADTLALALANEVCSPHPPPLCRGEHLPAEHCHDLTPRTLANTHTQTVLWLAGVPLCQMVWCHGPVLAHEPPAQCHLELVLVPSPL